MLHRDKRAFDGALLKDENERRTDHGTRSKATFKETDRKAKRL